LPIVLNFKGSNCKIKKGEKIGIVGRTGAGKTTLINTLLRITEIADGDVLIDGKSILSLPLKDLRNDITMIDQEPTLIKSTFQENLDITGKYTN
jgi:ATP-binding cassette subfamily B protein